MDKIKLIALDLDGTITQHKTKLEPENRYMLDKLMERYRMVIIGAGDCQRIWEQMNRYPVDIIGNYGMQSSRTENGRLFVTEIGRASSDYEDLSVRANLLREKLGLQNFLGDTLEIHESGLITFPILGTQAKGDDKLLYDPDRKKRRAMYFEVKAMFSEYSVFIGGSSSFDLVPPPYGKLYALEQYISPLNFTHENIVFIGDDYGLGGNDEPIYKSDIDFIIIDDYREFSSVTKGFLNEL